MQPLSSGLGYKIANLVTRVRVPAAAKREYYEKINNTGIINDFINKPCTCLCY